MEGGGQYRCIFALAGGVSFCGPGGFCPFMTFHEHVCSAASLAEQGSFCVRGSKFKDIARFWGLLGWTIT